MSDVDEPATTEAAAEAPVEVGAKRALDDDDAADEGVEKKARVEDEEAPADAEEAPADAVLKAGAYTRPLLSST
jgi:hypothetical protein